MKSTGKSGGRGKNPYANPFAKGAPARPGKAAAKPTSRAPAKAAAKAPPQRVAKAATGGLMETVPRRAPTSAFGMNTAAAARSKPAPAPAASRTEAQKAFFQDIQNKMRGPRPWQEGGTRAVLGRDGDASGDGSGGRGR